jgi:hypothetical protein
MPHKSSGRKLEEPSYASSSSAMPFDPTGDSIKKIKPYGGGKSAHSRGDSAISRVAPHPSGKGALIGADGAKAARHGQAPTATSLPGSLGIIEHPSGGRDHNLGIPGIISSTSLGPNQRQRLVAGIIESAMSAPSHNSGAVHAVMGHDSTAYSEGMVHIRGSGFK